MMNVQNVESSTNKGFLSFKDRVNVEKAVL